MQTTKQIWETINEGGEGYRPTVASARSAIQILCEIDDQNDRINRWLHSSDMVANEIIAIARAKISELQAELKA